MIRSHSQNLRPNPKGEENETLIALRLREAFEREKARKRELEES